MNFNITPNMGMPNPIPGVDPGPDYAENLESSFNIVDFHNHAPGKGVLINPNGININADLAINSNNLTLVKTVNFTNLVAPLSGLAPNLGAAYVAGGELYYNDESGNVVQITNMGSVNAGAGSITGLPSGTASASYSAGSQTFIWQSATSTAANMDNGSVTIREVAPSANGITLSSPTALAANYTITLLPTLPGSTSFLTIDNSGNLGTTPATGAFITTGNIADGAITVPKISNTVNLLTSTSSGGASNGSATPTLVPNQSLTITTSGKPVSITFQGDGGGTPSTIGNESGSASSNYQISRNGTVFSFIAVNGSNVEVPPGTLNCIDTPAAGTYTYQLLFLNPAVSGVTTAKFLIMTVREW